MIIIDTNYDNSDDDNDSDDDYNDNNNDNQRYWLYILWVWAGPSDFWPLTFDHLLSCDIHWEGPGRGQQPYPDSSPPCRLLVLLSGFTSW